MAASSHRDWSLAVFRIGSWACLLVALATAAEVAWQNTRAAASERAQVDVQNELKLAAAQDRVASYLAQVGLALRTISLHDEVRAGRTTARDYLRSVFESHYQLHQLAEVYVVERGFDGRRRPLMTFEMGEAGRSVEEVHSPEREAHEYAELQTQLARFAANPKHDDALSAPLSLCVGGPGVIYSVPIRNGPEFVGLVAGMIPLDILAQQLATSGLQSEITLIDADRRPIAGFGRGGTDRLIPAEPAARHLPLNAAAAPGWRLVLHERAGSAASPWARWLAPTLIVLLGVAASVVFRIAPVLLAARRESERHRCREAELARVARLVTVGELGAGLAHELAQPLAAIATHAEASRRMLARGGETPEELITDLDEISAQARRAGRIVEFLRGFVRRRAAAPGFEDLNDVVAQVIDVLDAEARRRRIVLDFEPGAIPAARFERIGIEQVLTNLIRNAFDAVEPMPSIRRTVTVRTCGQRDPTPRVVCEVRDRGVGADGASLERFFEPFYTSRPDGLGLGLAICRTIIESHDGELTGAENADGGLTMRFWIPSAGAS
ncbi:MAG: ATP-binding protein [Phycisphaerae bacterium]